MKRRDFARTCSMALTGALALPALAQMRYEAGKDYLTLDKLVGVDAPAGKVEIIEFFWYNCPHCNAFEPTFEAWVKRLPKDVALRRVPVAFQDSFKPQQQFYYALEALGLVDKLHTRVFQAIHTEHKRLDRAEAIGDWVASQGVDRGKFMEQFNSFSVAGKVARATQLTEDYKVQGVPALGIAGRYYTDGSMTQTMERSLQVAEYLAAEIRRGR